MSSSHKTLQLTTFIPISVSVGRSSMDSLFLKIKGFTFFMCWFFVYYMYIPLITKIIFIIMVLIKIKEMLKGSHYQCNNNKNM